MRGMLNNGQPWQQRLVMMVKAPKAGCAKTRLARDIGKARAAGFYRHATSALVTRLGTDRRWEMVLAVDPVSALYQDWTSVWPAHIARVAQGGGDLGDRMGRLFQDMPPGPIVIIGSDSPHVSTDLITEAFARLRGNDVVIGPAPDGGYWLIGLRRARHAPALFENVRWSTQYTLEDTLATLPDSFRVATLPVLADIDEGEDLQANPDVLIRSQAVRA